MSLCLSYVKCTAVVPSMAISKPPSFFQTLQLLQSIIESRMNETVNTGLNVLFLGDLVRFFLI